MGLVGLVVSRNGPVFLDFNPNLIDLLAVDAVLVFGEQLTKERFVSFV